MIRKLTVGAILLAALPALAGNIADCEVVVMDAVEGEATSGVAAAFLDAGEVISSMLDPERPTLAVIDGRPVQALMCTRRNPVPDAEDVPLIASGIPFILSSDFDSDSAPVVTLALDEERRAVARMAVGLSAPQETALADFLDAYEPQDAKFTGDAEETGGESDIEAASEMESAEADADMAMDSQMDDITEDDMAQNGADESDEIMDTEAAE